MSSSASSAPAPEGAPGKSKGRYVMIAGAALLVLLLGGGAAAYFGGFLGSGDKADAEEAGHAPTEEVKKETAPPPPPAWAFVKVPDLIVNLKSTGTRMRFLRLKVTLQVADALNVEHVTKLEPRILDAYQLYLRSLSADDATGSEGMQRLKEDLLLRTNMAIGDSMVSDVLINEMLLQ